MSATFDPARTGTYIALSGGNLTATRSNFGSGVSQSFCTFGLLTGKWYWEFEMVSNINDGVFEFGQEFGIGLSTEPLDSAYLGETTDSYSYLSYSGDIQNGGATIPFGAALTNGDVLGFAFDADAGTLECFVNNISQGVAFTGIPAGPWYPGASIWGNSAGNVVVNGAFSIADQTYTAPAGYDGDLSDAGGYAFHATITDDADTSAEANMADFSQTDDSDTLSSLVNPFTFLSDSIVFADPPVGDMYVSASSGLALTDVPQAQAWMVLYESLVLTGAATAFAHLQGDLSDSLVFADRPLIQFLVTLSDSLAITGNTTETAARYMAIVDTMVLTGVATGTVHAIANIADILALQDVALSVQDGTISDSLDLVAALETQVAYFSEIVAALVFADSMAGSAVLTVLMDDTIALNTTLTPVAHLIAAIRDELEFAVSFDLGDTLYTAYSMNAISKGLTKYTNFKFDSMASYRGQTYATGAGGIYKLGGTTDAGAGIVWRIRTGMTNFETGRNKGMDAAYLGYTATGRVVLKCIVVEPGTGRKLSYLYELTAPVTGAAHPGRILTGRGLRSVYWGFELTSLDGGSIDLDTLELHPVMFEGRLP